MIGGGTTPQSEHYTQFMWKCFEFFLSLFVLYTIARDCETKIKPV